MLDNYRELFDMLPFFNFFPEEVKRSILLATFPKMLMKGILLGFDMKYNFDELYVIVEGTVDMVNGEG